MNDDVHSHDIVLDVEHIRRWSTAIGRHVTYVAVPGARHDVVLSLPGRAPRRTTRSAAGWRRTSTDPGPERSLGSRA